MLMYVGKILDCATASQAKPNTRLTVQAVTALSEHGTVASAVIHDRVDFAGSMIDGRTVMELDGKGRSATEIRELWAFVRKRLTLRKKARKAS
jgi:chromosome partitioning protein